MILASMLALQVGPNPVGGALPGVPDELLNRLPRPSETAPDNPTSQWLAQCFKQLEDDPARAHTQAQIQRNRTLGAERVIANHCLGMAATELGLWDDARTAFLASRDETPAEEPRMRARFGILAGNAALAGNQTETALGLFATAQADAELAASATLQATAATDAARAMVALNRPEEALAALETATMLEPQKGDGWLLKATLLRRLGRLDEAQAAIESAATVAPQNAEIGLEAGVIAVLSGRTEAARKSWQSVLAIQPDSLAAATAKDYLAQIGPAETPAETGEREQSP